MASSDASCQKSQKFRLHPLSQTTAVPASRTIAALLKEGPADGKLPGLPIQGAPRVAAAHCLDLQVQLLTHQLSKILHFNGYAKCAGNICFRSGAAIQASSH